jgi:CRISPR-associated protein Cmr2
LRDFLKREDVSRRAVYHTLEWLNDKSLPVPTGDGSLLQTLLAYQLDRQANGKAAKQQAPELAQRLTRLTLDWPEHQRVEKLRNFLSVAEFLAREARAGDLQGDDA